MKVYNEFSRSGDVFVVNTQGFSEEHFALLLKSLENPGIGDIWMYGRQESDYPATIRSRCQLFYVQSDENVLILQELESVLEKIKAEKTSDSITKDVPQADSLLPYVKHLGRYDMSMAVRMVLMKSAFVDFLYMLDGANMLSFSTLMTFAERLNDEIVILNLYGEWLAENPLFSDNQLRLCSEIRDYKLKAEFDKKEVFGKFFVPLLICWKMSRAK